MSENAGRRPRWFDVCLLAAGTILVSYGGLGLLFDLHLPQRVAQAISLWQGLRATGTWPGPETAYPWNIPSWFSAVLTHFDRAVLIVWLAWGAGIVLLTFGQKHRRGTSVVRRHRLSWRDGAALALLAGVTALGYLLRARFLLPLADGTVPISHYDEMVYLEATLLWQRGVPPYSGFLLAHPPGILYAFWPAVAFSGPWGGMGLLIAGRWVQLVAGLLTVGLLYFVGRELAGRRGGVLAALVLALDVHAAQVAPLETIVNLAVVAGLGLYLAGRKASRRWVRFLCVALSGGLLSWGALTKIPGAVGFILLGAWVVLSRQWRDLLAGTIGGLAAALVLALPFAASAPGAFWRQVVAFQLLRPQETLYGRNHLARMAEYPESRLTFLLLIGVILLLTGIALREGWGRVFRPGKGKPSSGLGEAASWALPLVLTIVPLLFLFSYGRAYHSRYYVQLIVPLALLVAIGFGPALARLRRCPVWGRALALVATAGLSVMFWPHLVHQRMIGEMVRYDGTYGPIGEALDQAVVQGAPVFALDPGYPLASGRPPAWLPDGTQLVDGAGLMAYRVLQVAGMGPGEVWRNARAASREIDPNAIFHQPAGQDLIVTALHGTAAAVIDPRIAAEDMTPQTQEFVATRGPEILWKQYTAAFAVERRTVLGENESGLALWDVNLRPLTAEGEGPAVAPGEPLHVIAGEVAQVSLYWVVMERPAVPLMVTLELRDESEQAVGRMREPPHFGEPPTDQWAVGWVYQDHHNVLIPADLPAGQYRLYVNLVEASSKRVLFWGEGAPPGEFLRIGTIVVEP